MLSKFIKKSAQKWLIFPIKASFERSLIEKILRCWSQAENASQAPLIEQYEQTVADKGERKRAKGGQGLQKKSAYNRSPYHFNAVDMLQKIL